MPDSKEHRDETTGQKKQIDSKTKNTSLFLSIIKCASMLMF